MKANIDINADNLLQNNRFFPLLEQDQVIDANSQFISNPNSSTPNPDPSTLNSFAPKIKIPPIFLPTSNYRMPI